MDETLPEITFVIPAYNEARELPLTLSCLHQAAQALQPLSYEVIVCDNNSTDDTAAIARAHQAQVVQEPVRQIARARNAGAHAARGKWLIFLDADTRINRVLLNSVMRKIRSGTFGLGGSLVQFDIDDLEYFPACVISAWNCVSTLTGWAAGSFLACSHQAFRETGGFHNDFYAGEEIEFSLRLRRWCRQHHLQTFIETTAPVITSGRKIRGKSTWQMVQQLTILFPGALTSKKACSFWYDDKWRE
jgi:glycosyltransferase involved in cell wall biosynthesis